MLVRAGSGRWLPGSGPCTVRGCSREGLGVLPSQICSLCFMWASFTFSASVEGGGGCSRWQPIMSWYTKTPAMEPSRGETMGTHHQCRPVLGGTDTHGAGGEGWARRRGRLSQSGSQKELHLRENLRAPTCNGREKTGAKVPSRVDSIARVEAHGRADDQDHQAYSECFQAAGHWVVVGVHDGQYAHNEGSCAYKLGRKQAGLEQFPLPLPCLSIPTSSLEPCHLSCMCACKRISGKPPPGSDTAG